MIAGHSGEIEFETLDQFFKKAIAYLPQERTARRNAGPFRPARPSRPPTRRCAFRARCWPTRRSDRLFIADSNHNRIVVARLDGTLIDTIGCGEAGSADGDYAKATFNHPQGMALDGETLYVADTENHLLRKVDLKKHEVTTSGRHRQTSRRPGSQSSARRASRARHGAEQPLGAVDS